jgi:UDP-GlcNAc:undecaprenyl-phosphate GlcNAc-1-phosphate transferase
MIDAILLPHIFLYSVFASVVTVIYCQFYRPIYISLGIVAISGGNSSHLGKVPLVGGIAILSSLVTIALLNGDEVLYDSRLLFAVLPLWFVSLVDDKYPISPFLRLGVQAIAVLMLMRVFDIDISYIGPEEGTRIYFGELAPLVTLLFGLFIINAFNWIDGLDGLCATVSVVGFALMYAISGAQEQLLSIALIFALLGFLLLNFPYKYRAIFERRFGRFRCFLGDNGSASLGILFVVLMIVTSSRDDVYDIDISYAWFFIVIPIFDALHTMYYRISRRRSPFFGDKDHLHHLLAEQFSRQSILIRYFIVSSFFALLGFICIINGIGFYMNIALFCLSLLAFTVTKNRYIKKYRSL